VAFGAAHGGIPEEQVRNMLRQFTEQRFVEPGEFRAQGEFERFEQESRKRFEEFRQLEEQFRGPGTSGFPGQKGFPQIPGFEQEEGGVPSFGGFAGPGGCASPSECIKYCTENKDECFSFGPPGQPQVLPGEGGIPRGKEFGLPQEEFVPRLQENLILEFKPEEIQLFQFRGQEDRKEFFKQKFEEFQGEEGLPFKGGMCPAAPYIPCPEGTVEKTYTNQDGCPVQQCIAAADASLQDDKAGACAREGGVWDGGTCRPPSAPEQFFPETRPIQEQIFQQTQEQVQRQVQQQELEQQIHQQEQELQQQLQLLQQQTSPQQFSPPPSPESFVAPPSPTPPVFTPPPTSTGGSVLDAVGKLLKRLIGR
jgi:hypothetical protein